MTETYKHLCSGQWYWLRLVTSECSKVASKKNVITSSRQRGVSLNPKSALRSLSILETYLTFSMTNYILENKTWHTVKSRNFFIFFKSKTFLNCN